MQILCIRSWLIPNQCHTQTCFGLTISWSLCRDSFEISNVPHRGGWESENSRSKMPFTRSSPLEVFLKKVVLKICSKFTGERACQRVISIKFQSNFIEITLRHRCSPVHFLNIFRTLFPKNTSRRLLLLYESIFWFCVF